MKYLIFILLIIPLSLFSQKDSLKQEYYFTTNLRNSKIDTVFDYYFKVGAEIQYKKHKYEAFVNFERDNAVFYYSYFLKAYQKKYKAEYFKDTEKDIEYLAGNYNFVRTKHFNFGYDGCFTDKLRHSIYGAFTVKYFKLELAFLNKINRFTLKFDPEFEIKKNINIGFDCNVLYIYKKFKWNTGFKLNVKI